MVPKPLNLFAKHSKSAQGLTMHSMQSVCWAWQLQTSPNRAQTHSKPAQIKSCTYWKTSCFVRRLEIYFGWQEMHCSPCCDSTLMRLGKESWLHAAVAHGFGIDNQLHSVPHMSRVQLLQAMAIGCDACHGRLSRAAHRHVTAVYTGAVSYTIYLAPYSAALRKASSKTACMATSAGHNNLCNI